MKKDCKKASKQQTNKSLSNNMQQQCDNNNSSVENKINATEYGKEYSENVEQHQDAE